MNRFMTFIILSLFLTASTVARAGDTLPAFPGAEGFGAGSIGGRGGRVIKVTNLGTRGPGSLQAACSAKGPRIVAFDVSGDIPGNVVIEHGRISIMETDWPSCVTISSKAWGSFKTLGDVADKLPGLKYYRRGTGKRRSTNSLVARSHHALARDGLPTRAAAGRLPSTRRHHSTNCPRSTNRNWCVGAFRDGTIDAGSEPTAAATGFRRGRHARRLGSSTRVGSP